MLFFSGESRFAPTEVKPTPFLAKTSGRETLMSSGRRQPTATHGFDGTNWK